MEAFSFSMCKKLVQVASWGAYLGKRNVICSTGLTCHGKDKLGCLSLDFLLGFSKYVFDFGFVSGNLIFHTLYSFVLFVFENDNFSIK